MKIGRVAAQAGVSIDTVRFYERRGVLPAPDRTPSGYRIYEASTVERIRFARALQLLGFTLDEAIDALHSHDTGTATCESELWRMQAVIVLSWRRPRALARTAPLEPLGEPLSPELPKP